MSQTYSDMLAKVQEFHDKHEFSNKKYRGHDMSYRILLTIEELGELAECFTKGKPDEEKAEELATKIRMQPENSSLRLELAKLYEENDQRDRALMVYRQAAYIGNAEADRRIEILLNQEPQQ